MLATRTINNLFRPKVIVGALPVTLTNGTTADASQVMADLNWLVNQVNSNAAPLATTALVNANNNFTVVQSGVAATQAANFPIASQVQNEVFNTLTSTLGTNTLTARIAALTLGAYVSGQVFTFIPSQTNTGSATIAIDGLASGVIRSNAGQLVGGELLAGATAMLRVNSTAGMPVLDLVGPVTQNFSVGTFTRDISTASGTQTVTGVPFRPKAVIFFGNITGTSRASWGMDIAGGATFCVYDNFVVAADTYGNVTNASILLESGITPDYAFAAVRNFTADGWVLDWTKVSAPVGSATIGYLALR